jgi:nicotinamidase-related amidase
MGDSFQRAMEELRKEGKVSKSPFLDEDPTNLVNKKRIREERIERKMREWGKLSEKDEKDLVRIEGLQAEVEKDYEGLGEERFAAHMASQTDKISEFEAQARALEAHYGGDPNKEYQNMREKFKAYLNGKISQLNGEQKLVIDLVDIQNDFALASGGLYAPGGESMILSNMALLDALEEIIKENPSLSEKVIIMTSQDAHRYHRKENDPEVKAMGKAFHKDQVEYVKQKEAAELLPFGVSLGDSYGFHCMMGTKGVEIAAPIEARLKELKELGIAIHRFGKINFSGPEAGMLLKEGIELGSPSVLEKNANIYDERCISYNEFLENQGVDNPLVVTGICLNVCVQQAAEGAPNKEKTVLVTASYPLHTVNGKTLEEATVETISTLNAQGINCDEMEGHPLKETYTASCSQDPPDVTYTV